MDRVRRHRPRGAQLGMLRRDRRAHCAARRRRVAADPVGQARRRVPHARRRAARADRQLEPRAALGDAGNVQRARPQGPDDVRPDDGRLVDLHRQPGHRAGHVRDVRRSGRASTTAARSTDKWILTAGLGGMGGAQPLAATMAGASMLAIECQQSRIDMRLATRYLDRQARDLDEALALMEDACRRAGRCRWACSATRPRSCRSSRVARRGGTSPHMVTDQTSAHDLVHGYLPAGWRSSAGRRRSAMPISIRRSSRPRARRSRSTSRRCSRSTRAAIPTFDYGNNIRQVALRRRRRERVRLSRLRAGVHPAAVLRRQGAVPLGRAVRRSRGHRARPIARCASCFRTTRACALARPGRRAHRVPGTAGAHLLAGPRRARIARGSRSTRWSRAAS